MTSSTQVALDNSDDKNKHCKMILVTFCDFGFLHKKTLFSSVKNKTKQETFIDLSGLRNNFAEQVGPYLACNCHIVQYRFGRIFSIVYLYLQ